MASSELIATRPDAPSALPALMTLKPNQPTQSIHEPSARNGMLDAAVDAIRNAANTGKIGDGKIFVTAVERVIRIRTGEEDADALS